MPEARTQARFVYTRPLSMMSSKGPAGRWSAATFDPEDVADAPATATAALGWLGAPQAKLHASRRTRPDAIRWSVGGRHDHRNSFGVVAGVSFIAATPNADYFV
jgi:hypothetical protein